VGAKATGLGINLITNGDAEIAGGTTPYGWTHVTGTFEIVRWGSTAWPRSTDPGPENRGTYLYVGGGTVSSSGQQLIALSPSLNALVDSTRVYATASAYLGGFGSQADDATMFIFFLDTVKKQIGGVQLGPVTASERNNTTGLFPRTVRSLLPTGTRFINITLAMRRFAGGDNDGYADNLSLVLTQS
jgi:hypothetical protein